MRRRVSLLGAVALAVAGCGPRPPEVILDRPPDFPEAVGARRLFHTPNAYIYARNDVDAGEADRWVREIKSYIKRKHKADLEKGVVLVMDPADPPVIDTLEEQVLLDRDPSIMVTRPRKPKSVEEVRKRLVDEGVPEKPMVRGTSVVVPRSITKEMELKLPDVPWVVAAPSHALAIECGVEVGVGALRKKRPDISEEQARKVVRSLENSFAKPFEMVRGTPVYIAWVQRQAQWTDAERREAILDYLRHLYRSNWIPVPSEDELQW